MAELLFPLLPLDHARPAGQANITGPFGEVIANDIVPPPSQALQAPPSVPVPEKAAA